MSTNNQNQRLNGSSVLSYTGQNPSQPTNFTTATTSPTVDDSRGFNLGDWWLNTSNNTIWYLAATNGLTASWINVQGSGSGLLTLEGNSGGEIPPESGNINIVGDGETISVVGTPGTSTLTVSLVGGGVPGTLTGNTGGAVGPTAGNIDVVGAGEISVTGNPVTSTLTISQSGLVATSFATQAGTAVPVANVLRVFGSNNISTSGAGSTVTVTAGTNIAQSYITNPATAAATPSSGVLTLAGAGTTTVSASGSTITITNSAVAPVSYSEGSFTPFMTASGVEIAGASYSFREGYYVQIGNVAFIYATLSIFTSTLRIGPLGLGGLPFVVNNIYGLGNVGGCNILNPSNFQSAGLGNSTAWWGEFVPNASRLNFRWMTNSGAANPVDTTKVGASATFGLSVDGFYFI